MTVRRLSSPIGQQSASRSSSAGMEHHVYRLTDDSVAVVIISRGQLPPTGPWSSRTVRELIGVYDTRVDARAAARFVRTASRGNHKGNSTPPT